MKLPLAPLDYYFARPNLFAISFAFRYGYRLDAHRLKQALREVTEVFVPLRMKLEREGEKLTLVEGTEPVLETIESQQPFLALRTSLGEPLFRIGLGHNAESSVLSLTMSHGLGDGHSFFAVVNALAQAYQGKDFPTPELDRTALEPTTQSAEPFDIQHLPNRISYFLGDTPDKEVAANNKEFFTLPVKHDTHGTESDYSMAQLLHRYPEQSQYKEEYLLRFPVDFRRLLPTLSNHYFGNAVRDALLRLPRHPQHYSVSELAQRIRNAKEAINESNVRDALLCYSQLRKHSGIEAFQRLQFPGLLVSNFSRLPLEQMDFGEGIPTKVEMGEGPPGLAVLRSKERHEFRGTYFF